MRTTMKKTRMVITLIIQINCGMEGETNIQQILNLRFRKLCMFHCLLMLSNGIPMLAGGDEFGRTQQSNNNAYCHDSPLTCLD